MRYSMDGTYNRVQDVIRAENSINYKVKKKVKKPSALKTFSTKHTKAKQKTIINNFLSRKGRRDGNAIILDGPDIKTTKALIRNGWNKNRISIPNFSKDYEKIAKKHTNSECISLGEFLDGAQPDSVGLIYADYMCSVDGNKDCDPLVDVNKMFERGILMDGSALGITISLRSKKSDKNFISAPQKIINHVMKTAFDNGFTTILNDVGGSYKNGGPMWSGIFTILKQ